MAGTYKPVPQHPAGWLDVVSAIPYGFERAAGAVVLTFLVGACMGLIKRAGLIDLGVQKLSKAVGTSESFVAPVLMLVLSLLARLHRRARAVACLSARFPAALLPPRL